MTARQRWRWSLGGGRIANDGGPAQFSQRRELYGGKVCSECVAGIFTLTHLNNNIGVIVGHVPNSSSPLLLL